MDLEHAGFDPLESIHKLKLENEDKLKMENEHKIEWCKLHVGKNYQLYQPFTL